MAKKKKQTANIILIIIVVALVALVLFQGVMLSSLSQKVTDLSSQQSSFNSLVSQVRNEKIEFNNKLDELIAEIANLDAETAGNLENLKSKISEVEETSQSNIEAIKGDIANLDTDFSDFIEELYPSVVSVRTNKGQGSGFFIRPDGYIVTNAHVLKGATKVYAITHDGQIKDAFVVGSSDSYDIAVLKIRGSDYSFLEFEEKENIKVGQKVIAIGNPLGLSFSVSQGVISALDREFKPSLVNFIQTDTPINQGNSGGPVINANRKVIGIATGMISNTEGLGFAIPSYQAKEVIDKMI